MIKFMRLVNFRCFEDVQLHFPETPGLCAVIGEHAGSDYADSNGVGKSTLYFGISWVIYGEFPGMRSVRSILRRDMPRGGVTEGEIILTCARGTLRITRKRTRSKETVEYALNGGPTESRDAAAANSGIAEIVGAPYKLFSQLLVFSGDFTFAHQSDAPIKSILSAFCPIDVTAAQKTAAAARGAGAAKIATMEGRLSAMRTQKDSLSAQRDDALKQVGTWTAGRAAYMEQLRRQQREQEVAVTVANTGVAAAEQACAGSAPDVVALRAMYDAQKQRYDASSAQLNALRREADGLLDKKKALGTAADAAVCMSCGQKLPLHMQADRDQAAAESVRLIDIRLKALSEEATKASDTMALAADAGAKHLRAIEAAAVNEKAWTDAKHRLNDWRSEKKRADDVLTATNSAITHAANESNPFAYAAQQATSAIADLERAMAAHTADLKTTQDRQDALAYVDAMCGKKGLAHFALENLLPTLSTRAALYLAALSPQEMSVAFRARTDGGSEGFHVHAEAKHGGDNYDDLSGGEQRRIDAVVFLALYDIAMLTLWNPGTLFLDELLDHSTDQSGKLALIGMLSEYARRNGQVIFVVTNDKMVANERTMFQHVVRVNRSGDTSSVSIQ